MLELIEKTLDEVLPPLSERPTVLSEAMRYAVGSGGKRIRPLVCLLSAVAAGGAAEDAKYPAAAIELLHNYTLIHDDLPSFDNDTMRRGRETVWKRFGEATAVLAGDALLSLAFGVASKAPRRTAEIVAALSLRGVGVVQGQMEDLDGPARAADDFVYLHKTSDLFMAAAEMGALAAGGADDAVASLSAFARNLGLAFQYEDDLLDGDGLYSREETARRADEATAAALDALTALPGDVDPLRELARKLLKRKV